MPTGVRWPCKVRREIRATRETKAIKVFRVLPRDWTEETGEITPSLKVKRNVVLKEYADEIAAIYAG